MVVGKTSIILGDEYHSTVVFQKRLTLGVHRVTFLVFDQLPNRLTRELLCKRLVAREDVDVPRSIATSHALLRGSRNPG